MSLQRTAFFAALALFTAGMTSVASAGCCNWQPAAPVVYAGTPGCGGCGTPTAAVVYAEPVAPTPVVTVGTWTAGWDGGCGCHRPVVYAAPIAPAPIYVVNQGPVYTGPGIMIRYRTWAPYTTPTAYPYVHGYHHFYYGRRVFYHRAYFHPHYGPGPYWRHYHQLRVRG